MCYTIFTCKYSKIFTLVNEGEICVKENKTGVIVFCVLVLITAFGLGYFAGHTAERNTVQINTVPSATVDASQEAETPPQQPVLTGPVNINTAGESELQSLPGIGPALASRIVDYRSTHGPFQSIEQIKNVEGIGDGRYEELRYRITTGG